LGTNRVMNFLTDNSRGKRKYQVTVVCTRVEMWEVEASSSEDAKINYEGGELMSEEVHKETSDICEVTD